MTKLTINTREESTLRDLFNTILTEVSQCEFFTCDELTIEIDNDKYYAFKYVDDDGHVLYDICGRKKSLVQIHLPKDDTCDDLEYRIVNRIDLNKMYKPGTTITITEG